jgi:hypothetical protein
MNDLLEGKTWLVWDGPTAVATITVDTEEPLDANEQPVWPGREGREPALYMRLVMVSRRHAPWTGRGAIGLGGTYGGIVQGIQSQRTQVSLT